MLAKKTGLFLILSGTRENIKTIISDLCELLFLKISMSSFVYLFVKSSVGFENIQQYGVFLDLKSNRFCELLKKDKVKRFQAMLRRSQIFKARCSSQIHFLADVRESFQLFR